MEVEMKSTATSVDRYIAEQPPEWQASLRALRDACRLELAGYVEGIAHGMPSYSRDDLVEVGFAKQARYLSLYILNEPVLDAQRDRLAGISMGKGCVRYRRPEQIDWAVVTSLLAGTAASSAEIC
jgi:uncharacterized protein YdhG (YjbR/CyaY superfamily)